MSKATVSPTERTLTIEPRPLTGIKPYEKNARKISEAAIDKLVESISKFGWQQPIVVDQHGTIIIGHVRFLAAQKMKLKTVPVHVEAHLDSEQIRMLRIMDNRSHEEAKWDFSVLASELGELKIGGVDLAMTGFDEKELAKLLGTLSAPVAEGFTEVNENTVTTNRRCPKCSYEWSE
jgi:ParB-like chromosome segregation protein Spo0J